LMSNKTNALYDLFRSFLCDKRIMLTKPVEKYVSSFTNVYYQ
jgi:hypothetical protein